MLGPSGSGKSTLLNILGGLDVPTSGEVHYRDHNLTDATREELTRFRREHVGFVFQFYNLIPSLTALENTSLVTEMSTNPLNAEECLRMVRLGDRLHHFPAQLSGGEQQRVAIARAVVKRPECCCATNRLVPWTTRLDSSYWRFGIGSIGGSRLCSDHFATPAFFLTPFRGGPLFFQAFDCRPQPAPDHLFDLNLIAISIERIESFT